MTNFNERTNTLLYKNISLTLYSRKGDVSCVSEVSGDKDGLLFWPKFFLAHSSTSFSSWLGLLNRGSFRAQSPQSASWFSRFGILFPTDSNRPGHLVILLSHVQMLPLFFRLFTQVHLLIDCSVECQYITEGRPRNRRTPSYLTQPDSQGFCNPINCFSTIWLPYLDQPCLPLSYNKCMRHSNT